MAAETKKELELEIFHVLFISARRFGKALTEK
jgi:hypothetical protein